MLMTQACDLCDLFEENHAGKIADISAHSVLFPTVGAFIPGYFLVSPKRHVTRSTDLSSPEFEDMLQLAFDYKNYVEFANADLSVIIYEHGVVEPSEKDLLRSDEVSLPCISHAHLHTVMMRKSQIEAVMEKLQIVLGEPSLLTTHPQPGGSYSMAFPRPGEFLMYPRQPQRQLIRRVIAEVASEDNWNWRSAPFFERLQPNVMLYKKLKDNFALQYPKSA